MLHSLRRAVKSLPAKILLGILILSFAIWGIGDIFRATGASAVATVGDTEVASQQYADALLRTQRALSQKQRQAISLQQIRDTGLADAALARLLRDAAFSEELGRLGIAVPAEAVRRAIVDNPAFQDGQGKFSEFLYKSRLGNSDYSPASYEAMTRELLGQQLLADAVSPPAAPLPGAAEAVAARRGEERTVELTRLTPDMVPAPAAPDETTLKTWFEANKERFREPERRSGFYLHTNIAALAAGLAPTDEEVRAEYDAHPENYAVEPAREVEQIVFDDQAAAEDALRRIRAGEATFAEIAAEQNVSMADLSLGKLKRGDLPDASAEAVFGITEPGVVGPVEGLFGPMLLNVTAVQQGGTAPFDQVADQIRKEMATRKAREAVIDRANSIDDLRAAGTPLAEIADKLDGVELVHFKGLDPQGKVAEGEAPPLAADPAFMADVNAAAEGEERDLVQLSDGSYALVMLEAIEDSHLPELADVRDRVVAAWTAEQRMQALETRASELAARIPAAGGLAQMAEAEGLPAPEPVSFTRETAPPSLSPALADAAFAAKPGDPLVGRAADGEAVLLGQLEAVKPLAPEALADAAAKLDEAITGSLADDQLEYFGRAVQDRLGVEINPGAVEQVYTRLGQSAR